MYRHSSKIKTPYCQESNVYIFYSIHPSSACLYFCIYISMLVVHQTIVTFILVGESLYIQVSLR